ncbi:MAG: hypothetical protein JNM84_19600 [Planctomycetes bacterium]|nr:hypothetical protein [Planctomycetota bacterium]
MKLLFELARRSAVGVVGIAALLCSPPRARGQDAASTPAGEEGDLRNQTFLLPLSFERGEALAALRAALAEGALREAREALELVAFGPEDELVAFDERLVLSPREALPHLFAGADRALREAWQQRSPAPTWPPDAPPLGAEALAEIERRSPATPLAVAALRRAGDERWVAGDALAAAALYRRARLHAGPLESARRTLAPRSAACAAVLESPAAAHEVAVLHSMATEAAGPEGLDFGAWSQRARGALGLALPLASSEPSRFEFAWCEALDPDHERRRLSSDRGIRARGPRALETDLRPAFTADAVWVQDRRFLYRFEIEGGRREERLDLDAACAALGVAPRDEDAPPALGVLRRRPATVGNEVVAVHDDARGLLLGFRRGEGTAASTTLSWALAGGVLHRAGAAPRPVGPPLASGDAAPVFQPFPLVVDRRVFAVARRTSGGKERLELWCCDRASGEPLWVRRLCEGAPVRTQSSRSFRSSGGTLPTSAPVYSDGLVFVSTNLGVLAACDALDGAAAWMLLTARSREAGPRWSTSDPLVTRQGLFCGPQDADFLYALRRELPCGATRASELFLCPPLARGALEAHLVSSGARHYFYVRTPHWREVAELELAPASPEAGAPLEARWRTSGDTGSYEEDLLYVPAANGAELVLSTDRYLYVFDCARDFLATFRARTPLSPATGVPLPTRRVFGNVAAFRSGIVVLGAEGLSCWIRRP